MLRKEPEATLLLRNIILPVRHCSLLMEASSPAWLARWQQASGTAWLGLISLNRLSLKSSGLFTPQQSNWWQERRREKAIHYYKVPICALSSPLHFRMKQKYWPKFHISAVNLGACTLMQTHRQELCSMCVWALLSTWWHSTWRWRRRCCCSPDNVSSAPWWSILWSAETKQHQSASSQTLQSKTISQHRVRRYSFPRRFYTSKCVYRFWERSCIWKNNFTRSLREPSDGW